MRKFILLCIFVTLFSSCHHYWGRLPQLEGIERNQIFVLKHDAYLYRYVKTYALFPHDYPKSFTMSEFRENPEVGMLDRSNNIYYVTIVPKGTKIQFSKVTSRIDYVSGQRSYKYFCKILDKRFEKYRKVSFFYMLFTQSYEEIDEYLLTVQLEKK